MTEREQELAEWQAAFELRRAAQIKRNEVTLAEIDRLRIEFEECCNTGKPLNHALLLCRSITAQIALLYGSEVAR